MRPEPKMVLTPVFPYSCSNNKYHPLVRVNGPQPSTQETILWQAVWHRQTTKRCGRTTGFPQSRLTLRAVVGLSESTIFQARPSPPSNGTSDPWYRKFHPCNLLSLPEDSMTSYGYPQATRAAKTRSTEGDYHELQESNGT